MRRFADAVDALRHARQLAPVQISAAVNLATALQARGDIDGAAIELEDALELAPEMGEIWNNLGNLYKQQGRLRDALGA